MSDLVERLRNRMNDSPIHAEHLMDEAADRIAELEAWVKLLTEKLETIRGESERSNGNILHLRRCIHVQVKEALNSSARSE